MSAKAVLVFFAQALLIQSAFGDVSRFGTPFGWAGCAPGFGYDRIAAPFAYNGYADPYGFNGLAAPFAYDGFAGLGARGLAYDGLYPAITSSIEVTPTTSGAFTVTSSSAIPPTGISVVSENVYEGCLVMGGEVPFVGTTGMEGVLPTSGAAAVNHACGNGINVMASETTAFAPGYAPAAIAPGFAIGNSWAPAAGCRYGYVY